MKKFNIHPVALQLIGIVAFSVIFGERGFIFFTTMMLVRYNTLRWKAGWVHETPLTIMPVWLAKTHPHIRQFYLTGLRIGSIIMIVLGLLGWHYAQLIYLATWVSIFILDQVIAKLYMRRHKRRVQQGFVFLA